VESTVLTAVRTFEEAHGPYVAADDGTGAFAEAESAVLRAWQVSVVLVLEASTLLVCPADAIRSWSSTSTSAALARRRPHRRPRRCHAAPLAC
jgi:hypothetical protein